MKRLAVVLSMVAMSAQAVKLDPASLQDQDDFMKSFIGKADVIKIPNEVKPEETSKPKIDVETML